MLFFKLLMSVGIEPVLACNVFFARVKFVYGDVLQRFLFNVIIIMNMLNISFYKCRLHSIAVRSIDDTLGLE
ncbi:hypothetical protein EB796_003386 [Bugula neritina]|uniref:Uncharacterized protein n=1 Tax=Bugula neritina TaxID=10212 RepID=A0A7J7KJ64_BUGNE|nr:hypothetical protein EB796_003386 [Bugula neritina]